MGFITIKFLLELYERKIISNLIIYKTNFNYETTNYI